MLCLQLSHTPLLLRRFLFILFPSQMLGSLCSFCSPAPSTPPAVKENTVATEGPCKHIFAHLELYPPRGLPLCEQRGLSGGTQPHRNIATGGPVAASELLYIGDRSRLRISFVLNTKSLERESAASLTHSAVFQEAG